MHVLIVILVTAAALAGDTGEACRTTLDSLRDRVREAENAWKALDADGLQATVEQLVVELPCVVEPLTLVDASDYFRVVGLAGFLRGDVVGAHDAFFASRSIQPGYRLPLEIAGENHPLRDLFERVGAKIGEPPQQLAPPVEGHLAIDGRRATLAPGGRSYVFQWIGSDGAVRATAVVPPFERPEYPIARPAEPQPAPSPAMSAVAAPALAPPPQPPRRISRGLLGGGLAVGTLAGASMAGAALLEARYRASPPEEGDLQGLVTANRALGYGGIGLGVVAAGLGTSAVIVGRW